MNTTLREDAEKFADFIVRNYPDAKEWDDPVMKSAWYISHAFVAAVTNDDGEIVAICAARPVERPGIGVLPFYFNEEGTCMHVDLLVDISDDKRAMNVLEIFFKMRFPQCTTISMFRHFESKMNVYGIKKFWQSFHKLKRTKKRKRGALCRPCNLGIGLLEDDLERVLKAAQYLKTGKVVTSHEPIKSN